MSEKEVMERIKTLESKVEHLQMLVRDLGEAMLEDEIVRPSATRKAFMDWWERAKTI